VFARGRDGESKVGGSGAVLWVSVSVQRARIATVHGGSLRIRLRDQTLQRLHVDVCSRQRHLLRQGHQAWFP
jgi:hypothetical protein